MAEDQDKSQKTEEPTHKRREEAVKKGQVAFSREVGSFFILLTFTLLVVWQSPSLMRDTMETLSHFVQRPSDYPADAGNLGQVLEDMLRDIGAIMALPFLAFVVAALASGLIQKPLVFSLEPIKPKLEKISVLKGIKRMFSMRSIIEFLKGLVKITITVVIVAIVVWPEMNELKRLPNTEIYPFLDFLIMLISRVLISVAIIMFFVALLDYLYQRYEYIKSLRMSKQEIKDEYKQQEGDPMIKQRLRSIRMERARKRMMAEVPKADVVITNPTHFAVALKYDTKAMQAPTVIAKGADKVAARIRGVAEEHKIPIVRNPPLARSLYDDVALEEEVPTRLYQAVAEVISYVYRLQGKEL